ncbi:hypothetical protein BJ944DRAFT_230310 [Cunninghamella echinulata]|nr:hypothetical protein BJ944DRAFT_230310 [Cunninghamella echinulata]
MKFNLFKKKSSTKNNNDDKNNKRSKIHSPTQSMSSLSSSQSSLQTNDQETRGIFRTLEPVWSYVMPSSSQQWIQFKPDQQSILENAFQQHEPTCTIELSQKPILVYFNLPPPSPTTSASKSNLKNKKSSSSLKKKKRPVTQLIVPKHQQKGHSSPNLLQHQHHNQHSYQEDTLYLNHNIRRSLIPYWWFEQDNEQGFKGMCRFDQKNQVRLEALSDDRSTLTLTDVAFPIPFQVVLEPADRSSREEWRGFMYLNHHLTVIHPPSLPSPPLKHNSPPFIVVDDYTNDDVFYNHDLFLNRRSSI